MFLFTILFLYFKFKFLQILHQYFFLQAKILENVSKDSLHFNAGNKVLKILDTTLPY